MSMVRNNGQGDSAEDAVARGKKRPRRACRQFTEALVKEQALEELEEHKQTLDQRSIRLKEKNKRAQQRFRERQKEKSQQTSQQVDKLQQQVLHLRSRAFSAEDRCQLLERLLSLQQTNGDGFKEPMPIKIQESEQPLDLFIPYSGWTTLPEKEFAMVLKGRSPGQPLHVSKEQVAGMALSDHIACWRGYVESMNLALMDAEGSLDSPAAEHLQGLGNELFAWCTWVNKIAPHVLPKMQDMRLDNASFSERPEPQHMAAMLRNLGLSERQIQQMAAARRFCVATLASLMRERHSMCSTLQEVIEGGSSWNNMYASHPAMVEMSQRLSHNIEAESKAFHTFMTSALRRVLNPIQMASLVVRSFPYMPNAMGLIACLSEDPIGEGSDDDLLLTTPFSAQSPLSTTDSLGTSLEALWNDIYYQ